MSRADLAKINQRFAPSVIATKKTLEVPDFLEPLFPLGGLQCGWTVELSGNGARSMAMALAATVVESKDWLVCVDSEDLGLLCGHEVGLPLDRVLCVQVNRQELWPRTIAALLENVRIVLVTLTKPVSQGDARRLAVRTKSTDSVLLYLDGSKFWPPQADFGLNTYTKSWHGLQSGSGFLKARDLVINTYGRRANVSRTVEVELPERSSHSDRKFGKHFETV